MTCGKTFINEFYFIIFKLDGDSFNVGSGYEITFKGFALASCKIFQINESIQYPVRTASEDKSQTEESHSSSIHFQHFLTKNHLRLTQKKFKLKFSSKLPD